MAYTNERKYMHSEEDKVLSVSVVDDTGAAKTLVSAVFIMADIEKTSLSGIVINGSTLNITLDPADTKNMRGVYRYEVRGVDADDKSEVVATGEIFISESLTA